MSYFGQRLKIYFRCEREQLSNRLIMILESQAPPAPQGRNPEIWVVLGGLLRLSPSQEGEGSQCSIPPSRCHPAGEEGAPRAAAGAEQPWVIGSGRRWHGAAEKVITWDWEQNARSEGGAAPLAKVRSLLGCRRCFWQGSALAACTEVPAGPAHSGRAGSARSCQTCTDVSPRMWHQLLKAKPG